MLPVLKKIPHNFVPFSGRANTAYRAADALVAVSQTYLDRAHEANPDAPGEVVYIGADFDTLERVQAKTFSDGITRFFYLGTLSFSYDVETVCKGVQKLLDAGEKVALHIMGGGPDLEKLKAYANESIIFYGYVPYAEMIATAKGCDIAVNPIHSYAMQSITNKLSDYMALQKPILNSQVNDEVAEVLTLLPHADYPSGNVDAFVAAARRILQQRNGPVQSAEIVRRFKRDVAYQKIITLIEKLAHE